MQKRKSNPSDRKNARNDAATRGSVEQGAEVRRIESLKQVGLGGVGWDTGGRRRPPQKAGRDEMTSRWYSDDDDNRFRLRDKAASPSPYRPFSEERGVKRGGERGLGWEGSARVIPVLFLAKSTPPPREGRRAVA